MDRKSIIAIVICFALIVGWSVFVNKYLYPQKPLPPGSQETTAQATTSEGTNAPAGPTPVPAPAVVSTNVPGLNIPAGAPEQTIVLTNDKARYTFTSHGGGLKSIELLDYSEDATRKAGKVPLTNGFITLNKDATVPVLAVLGGEALQGDDMFTLLRTNNGVLAVKTLTNGLRLIKEFQLDSEYLVNTSVRLENTSGQPLALPEQKWIVGTATPMAPDDKSSALNVGMMWYNGAKKADINRYWFENRTLGCFRGVPRTEYRAGTSNVVWVSVHNQFFTLTAMPSVPAEAVYSRPVTLPRPSEDEMPLNRQSATPPEGYQTALVYPASILPAGQSVERKITFYAGPKEYRTLASIAGRFRNNVDLVMNFGWSGFFSKALLLGMNKLHSVFHVSYGWAIIVITIIIKTLFWPLTVRSTRSMKRMAAIQPLMKAIQEKYKEDPVKMQKKMGELWKEHKVNPMGGCLPMALQIPVFFGFFSMIRSAIELRGASFLWIKDLAQPDTLFYIPGTGFPFNLLPLIMGGSMLWQSHLTPTSPTADAMQQKMMRYMPLIFLVFLYNYSSGLALYWTVNNLLSILQTKLIAAKDPAVTTSAPVLTHPPKKKK